MAGAFSCLIGAVVAWAGPPFVTDDPEPVGMHHWEVYLASQYVHDDAGISSRCPSL